MSTSSRETAQAREARASAAVPIAGASEARRMMAQDEAAVAFPTLLGRSGHGHPAGFPPVALKASPGEPMKVTLSAASTSGQYNLTSGLSEVKRPPVPTLSSPSALAAAELRLQQKQQQQRISPSAAAAGMGSLEGLQARSSYLTPSQPPTPMPTPKEPPAGTALRLADLVAPELDESVMSMPPTPATAAGTASAPPTPAAATPRDAAASSRSLLQSGAPAPASPDADVDYAKIAAMAAQLAVDNEGHKLVEAALETGTSAQQLAIARNLLGSVVRLSTDVNGCWVVQKAIDMLPRAVQLELFQELASGIESCIESKHGNFVVQACIEQLPPDAAGFVVAAIDQNARHMACHKYGCRVVQRLLEHCPEQQVRGILDQIVEATVELSRHQYGCHVMRCVLERGNSKDRRQIFAAMCSDLVRLSRNRLSSLVLEKCVEVAARYEDVSSCSDEEALLHRDLRGLILFLLSNNRDPAMDEVPSETALASMAGTRAGRCFLRRLCDCAAAPEQTVLQAAVTATIRRRG